MHRLVSFFFLMLRLPPRSTLFPYTRSSDLLGRDHLLVPMPAAAGEIGVAVAVPRLGLLAGEAQVRDSVERHPLGEGLVAQIRGGARRGGERTHDRSHADRDDRQRHEHLDEREAVAGARALGGRMRQVGHGARASHGFDSTMGCSMTWPWSSWVTVTLRRPPSRSSVAAKLVRSPFEKIITCGVLSLASLGRVSTTGRASTVSFTPG